MSDTSTQRFETCVPAYRPSREEELLTAILEELREIRALLVRESRGTRSR